MRKIIAVALAVSVAGTATGCASIGSRRDAAVRAAQNFARAVAAEDGATACRLLSPEARHELEQSEQSPCPEAVLKEDLPRAGPVRGADLYGEAARVVFAGDTAFVHRFPAGWLVTGAGCSKRGGKPYDCLVKGG